MLIRVKGYNTGAKEYLEQGIKAGREFSRDELDERVMLDGDLDITRMVYDSIEDKGQDRYISITLAFREDHIPVETLLAVTQETKQFLMHAYKKDEFNFYAEAHLPKIKMIKDNATGEMIERKPHVHIIIPRKNLLSGNEANPVGMHDANVKYLEAFQEYINQKYNLASPREHVRADIKDAASVLSRYKGDDFYGKNREFKQDLVKQVIERGVVTRPDFYALVTEHGETRIRNEGKDNEYIAVKLPGDAKFTNLKDTIFHDDFIVRRELKKAPLDKKVIQDRLLAWPQRAKEIKYVSKATPAFRKLYTASSPDERLRLLADRERTFYQTYGDRYGSLHAPERERDHQRSAVEAKGRGPAGVAPGMQDLSVSNVADHGQAGQTGSSDGTVLLPGNAQLHLGQSQSGGDSRLRPPIRAGGGRGSTGESGRRQLTAFPQGPNGATKTAGARGTPRRPGRSKSVAPSFPRNPHRVPTIADIEARSQRLFGPLKRAVESELKFKRATIKSLTVNKSASTVAAYFNRQLEQNQLAPAQRHAIRRVNKQFFDLKRTLFTDSRLTREERTQLVSVLTFERLKANQQIKSTSSMSEVQLMGSAQIRHLITVEKEDPGFSFSGPTGPGPAGIRDRVKQILERVSRQLDQPASKERARELAAKDLYTKKARFSQNVHYLDKHSDKTLFVDSGKAISMRRTGITEGGVAVALQLAKERFGSTLTITGTAEFKALVIEAAAKNGVDVHFTDKDMNHSLLARRAELEIEKEAQTISPAGAPVESQPDQASAAEMPVVVVDAQSPSELIQREAAWRQSMQMPGSTALSEADVRSSDTVMGLRGEDHAIWLVATNDKSPEAMAMMTSYMENDSYRDAFKGAIESFYAKSQNSPESIQTLDEVTDFVVPMVNEIENRKLAASVSDVGTPAPASKQPDDRKLIVGVLVDHGAAPYQNNPDKEPSYFVTVETDAGNRTLWGAGLADAMQQTQFNQGERLRIEDKGTVPVTLLLPQDDGTLLEKPGYRREWSVDLETAVKAPLAVVTATTTSDAQERLESLSADTDISDTDQDVESNDVETVASFVPGADVPASDDDFFGAEEPDDLDHSDRGYEHVNSVDVDVDHLVLDIYDTGESYRWELVDNFGRTRHAESGYSTEELAIGAGLVVVSNIKLRQADVAPVALSPMQAEPEQDHGPEMD